MLPKLGIIAGDGSLPQQIRLQYEALGGEVFTAYIGAKQLKVVNNTKQFSIGHAGHIIKYFQDHAIKEVVLVGNVNRPNFSLLKLDITGSILLSKITKNKLIGDDNILRVISNFLEEQGFKVIAPNSVLEEDKVIISTAKPNQRNIDDILIGQEVLKSLGSFDIGQSLIIHDGYVLGIEAAEGTDNLIKRCTSLRKDNKGGILIKILKTDQDARLDTPVIGPKTIINLKENGYLGLAIEKNKILIAEYEEVKRLTNEANLFIHYLE